MRPLPWAVTGSRTWHLAPDHEAGEPLSTPNILRAYCGIAGKWGAPRSDPHRAMAAVSAPDLETIDRMITSDLWSWCSQCLLEWTEISSTTNPHLPRRIYHR